VVGLFVHFFFVMAKKEIKNAEILGSPGKTKISPHKKTGLIASNKGYIPFGSDNLFPQAIMYLNRKAGIHRGIMNRKITFINGRGFMFDDNNTKLSEFVNGCDYRGSNLRNLSKRFYTDRIFGGNGYIEFITDNKRSFFNMSHQDSTKCRVGEGDNEGYILLHSDWSTYESNRKTLKKLPIYPEFEEGEDGFLHSIFHVKEYEPEFDHYGVPSWIAGLNASSIAYKTNTWNISELDNGYKMSGLLVMDGEFKTPEEAKAFDKKLDAVYSGEGNQGRVLKVNKPPESDGSKFVPFPNKSEGNFLNLHKQSADELIVAHSWFPTLSGVGISNGFETEQILNEYYIALSTIIEEEQSVFLEMVRAVLDIQGICDASSLEFVNRPPVTTKPDYMRVWEGRRADGLDYDENDPAQKMFIGQMKNFKTIELTP